MRLYDYLEIARERIVVVLAIVIVTMMAVIALLLFQDPVHSASVRLRARPPAPGSAVNTIAQEQQQQTDLGTEAELVRSSKVADAVAQELNIPGNPDDLLNIVTAVPVGTTAVLKIEATAPTAPLAVDLANSFARKYLEVRRATLTDDLDAEAAVLSASLKTHLERLSAIDRVQAGAEPGSAESLAALAERDQAVADLTVTRARLDALASRAAIDVGFGEVIQEAKTASASRSQSLPRAMVFGMLLGIPLALASVLVLDSMSNDVRTRQDVERVAQADLIGVIPLDPSWGNPAVARLATRDDPLSPTAEAYRRLSFALARYAEVAGMKSLLVTSPGDGDGKTATVANLAVAAADTGRSTRVIGADLRNPRLHSFFDAPSSPGLSDVLAGEVPLDDALVQLGLGLELLPGGRPTERPDLLVSRGDLQGLIGGAPSPTPGRPLKARAAVTSSLVLVDSASILEAAEAARLAAMVDGVVLVARARTTSKQALSNAADQVRRVGGTVLGVVLVGVKSIEDSGISDPPRGPVDQLVD